MFERELDKALASNGRLIAAQEDAIAELRRRGAEIDRLRVKNTRLRLLVRALVNEVEALVEYDDIVLDRTEGVLSVARAALKEPDHG